MGEADCGRADGQTGKPVGMAGVANDPNMAQAADLVAIARRLLPSGSPEFYELTRPRPLRVWADIARAYSILILGFVLLLVTDVWGVGILAFLLIGTQQYALAILQHDGKHGTLLRRLSANDHLTVWLLCAPIGLDIDFMGREPVTWLITG